MDNGGEVGLPVDSVDGQPSSLSIRDVFEAISKADPKYSADVEMPRSVLRQGLPYVQIVEQPASKALRFRYECEGRSAGSIPGVNSKPERKSYPTIEICGHRGQVIIVVSCVTRDEPYKPHPHNLVGRERCENGVCTLKTTITDENSQVYFSNLGIQCIKRKDIAAALKTREKLRVDPYKTGFKHANQPQSIDLNAVRLCFQVFIPDESSGKIRQSLQPVVSDIIYDKKAMSDLIITRISHCSDFHRGGSELILLCEKVTREDIAVVFFQKKGDHVVWEAPANIVMVHKLTAIVFHTPPYRDPAYQHHVQVYLQLKRTSDNARSNAIPFEYIPEYQDASYLKHKRQKTVSPTLSMYDRFGNDHQVKSEPRDKTPPHPMGSPIGVFSPSHYEHEQVQETPYQWGMQAQMDMSGLSHIQYQQDVQWNQTYVPIAQTSPMQSLSPNHPMSTMASNLQTIPPNPRNLSPNMMSSLGQMGRISPMHGGVSPMAGSPGVSNPSPAMCHVGSPAMGNISPNLVQQQQLPQENLIELAPGDSTSLTNLLRGDAMPALGSDFSGLDSFLERAPDLTDSLNRLSTSDLLH